MYSKNQMFARWRIARQALLEDRNSFKTYTHTNKKTKRIYMQKHLIYLKKNHYI